MRPERTEPGARRRAVERVFYEMGWENLAQLDDWDGDELEPLRRVLPEEQFQALLDQLADEEPDAAP
jgi:hypothetical protein